MSPKLGNLKKQTFLISQLLWVRNLSVTWLGGSAQGPLEAVVKVPSGAAVISWLDFGGEGGLFLNSRMWLLEGFSSWWAVRLRV